MVGACVKCQWRWANVRKSSSSCLVVGIRVGHCIVVSLVLHQWLRSAGFLCLLPRVLLCMQRVLSVLCVL